MRAVADPDRPNPETTTPVHQVLVGIIDHLDEQIAGFGHDIPEQATEDEMVRRLSGVAGVGPAIAMALAALALAPETFKHGPDFASGIGLTALQRLVGGKQKLGATSTMGAQT
ncbi:transposase [Microvirga calopogonii]|uniref:transposase n=1 Tax=Microvirga calopogonii TaxID=2078013 RepID=UPI0013B44894|nr:transposase [Microvirga calopogonii]